MSDTRIYAVHDAGLDKTHLVRAKTPAAAVRHIARKQYTAEVATQNMLVIAINAGELVQDASSTGKAE